MTKFGHSSLLKRSFGQIRGDHSGNYMAVAD